MMTAGEIYELYNNFPNIISTQWPAKSDADFAKRCTKIQWCLEKLGNPAIELPFSGELFNSQTSNPDGIWVYQFGKFMFKNPSHAVEFKLRFG